MFDDFPKKLANCYSAYVQGTRMECHWLFVAQTVLSVITVCILVWVLIAFVQKHKPKY